ncbi:retinitis pigmentosa 1-like 1 protein, partial [Salmo trutta]|uniref:retinitis pigmentosa 1-like 1 protein n=1 Tax=Salmo trutta TaxID=8032 RepID=UPI0011300588
MQSAPAGLWDPHGPQSKDVSSLPVHTPSASRLSHVIAAPPAKRITFYKSGDAKFAGVRMAVHKRSFKCFDALLDDLSQKVPLAFGVRTVTTPRGIHSIKHIEQLEDGGCYLCSDRRQAKPINMELAGKRPALWHHNSTCVCVCVCVFMVWVCVCVCSWCVYSRRVPQRPAEDPPPPSAPSHTSTRQRRILLVRNSDPAVRRSVILSRRSARSLRVFLEDISETMQCHVRKLYTLEGRKPFRPLLLDYVTKRSEEKLPGLGTRSPGSGARSPGTGARSPGNGQGARSRSSVCSEGHGSKKNVNFGLETKKTILHPLSDSSNRSARFSLSSDKSYPNGLSSCPHSHGGKEAVLNDDIEKRVLVNKDGSLSVEMRVRFRLHNDKMLQWSTEIKKSPSDSLTNDCCPLREAQPCYLQQGQSESCSNSDSASCVVEAADYTPKPPQSHYACCFQRQDQEYDLWENPTHIQTSKHSHSRVRHTHSSSSSSSCRSSKLVRRRATHRECSEPGRVVQECCVREEVQRRLEVERDGGMVEVCTVSSSCSRSELNLSATDNQGEERPLSSSSHVLQALHDDVDDLPPSVSRCCHSNDPPQTLPLTPQPPSPMSTSSRSRKHTLAPTLQGEEVGEREEKRRDVGEERGSRTSSRRSSNSCSCCRGEVTPKADKERVDSSWSKASQASHGSRSPANSIRTPVAPEEGDDEAEQGGKRAVSVMSTHTGLSGGSGGSIGSHIGQSDLKKKRKRRGQGAHSQVAQMSVDFLRGPTGPTSTCSKAEQAPSPNSPEVPATEPEPTGEDEGEERAMISMSVKSNLSTKSSRSHKLTCSRNIRVVSPKPAASETLVNDPADAEERAASALSAKTNASAKSRRSCKSTGDDEGEEREARAMSAKTRASIKFNRSHKSACKATSPKPAACETPVNDPAEKTEEEKTASAMLDNNNASVKSSRSHKSTCSKTERAPSSNSPEVPGTEPTVDAEGEKRAASATSNCSRSLKSTCSKSVRAETPGTKDIPVIMTTGGEETVDDTTAAGDTEERPASAMLDNNNASVKSSRSHKSTCSKTERAPSSNSPEVPGTEPTVDAEGEKRAASATSNCSRSLKSTCSKSVRAETPGTKDIPVIMTTGGEETVDDTTAAGDTEERPASAISAKTSASVKSSRSHKSTCSRRVETPSSEPANVPVIETTGGDEVGEEEERAASVMSAKSNASAKSRRSNRPTCNGSSREVSPVAQDVPAIETTGGKEQRNKSTASVTSNRSHKSSSSRTAADQADVIETTRRDKKGEGTEKPASAMLTKSNASAKSSRSHKSTCTGSTRAVSPAPKTADSPAIETTGVDREGEKTEERPACSSTSHKSNGSNRSAFLHLKKERGERGVRPAPSTTGNDLETGSVKSALSTKPKRKEDSSITRPLSRASQASTKSTNQTPPATTETKEESQSQATSRPASKAAHRDDDVRDHVTEKKTPRVHSKSPAKAEGDSRAASSARSTRSKVKVQKASEAQDDERPETRASFLQVKFHRVKAQSDTGSVRSVKTSKTDKIVIKGNSKPKSAQAGNPTSQSFNPSEGSRPAIQLGTASVSDSLLSQSLSAADLLRGNMAASRPSSPAGSKVSIPDSGKSGSSQRRRKLKQEEAELEELGPHCLPKTSPNDVVSDWLRGIPADSGMDNPEDEMNEGIEETEEEEEDLENMAETGQQEEEEELENTAETGQQEEEEKLENTAETGQREEEEEVKKAARQPEEEGEISPVYGRRLSSSAKGLLDCLAQLQLIDPPPSPAAAPGPDRDQRYQEVMDILESLWLSKPDLQKRKEGDAEEKERLKDSGVDLTSGSAGSGGSGKTRPDKTGETDGGGEGKVGEGETDGGGEEAASAELLSDSATADIASQVRSSPGEDESPPESPPGRGEMLQTLERLKTPGSPSSSDSTAYKSPTDTERDTPEDTPSSGTPPSVQRALLTKRVSQDPDPVWVLNLLKKLEKQFMTHYVDAMAELKVRWDLDNNVMLDTMITELRDEVKKRIQMSIDRELRKIRGRAGRGPRPPNMSRESTITDQRRRRLKVMKVQSVNESDGEQGSGDVSDQRSEDEYCPCDACIRKKAEDKAIKMEAVVTKAPVMMAFDLRKILQMKKDPEPPTPPIPTQGKNNDNLEEEEEK